MKQIFHEGCIPIILTNITGLIEIINDVRSLNVSRYRHPSLSAPLRLPFGLATAIATIFAVATSITLALSHCRTMTYRWPKFSLKVASQKYRNALPVAHSVSA
ncbi:hypothetical protein PQQ99_15110 [Paraburkholderia sediminicola]|uniref:hypothetical protein n=1 Tax=Paraburkholderia sediminicola TaxID=458836 RepID=UPI0038B6D410